MATGFTFTTAPELVRILLGPGWEASATIIRFLSLGGLISGTNFAGGWVSTTHGWANRQLRVAMIAAPIYTIAFIAGSKWGPEGVAAAYSMACFAMRYPVLRYLCAGSPIQPKDILNPLLRVGWPMLLACASALLVSTYFGTGFVQIFLIKTAIYLAVLAAMWCVGRLELPRIDFGGKRTPKA
jgi:PST family polysaccharide transporter